MKNLFVAAVFFGLNAAAQKDYGDSMTTFISNYVQTHKVVKGSDRSLLQFYPVNKDYRVTAGFEKASESRWLSFPTSGKITKIYRVYGRLSFQLAGKPQRLTLYQSQDLMLSADYKDYLFLPFTDATTGNETYEGGRYIDLRLGDIQNGSVLLDFNKAYNPYCAYVSGKYNCPIPPKENALTVPVKAGEKAYRKQH